MAADQDIVDAIVDARNNKAVTASKYILEVLQTEAVTNDQTSLDTLDALGDLFVKNNDAVSRDLELNGVTYTFLAGKVYSAQSGTINFIISKAREKNYAIVASTSAAYGTDGEVEVFLG